jgi:hypothetical protein
MKTLTPTPITRTALPLCALLLLAVALAAPRPAAAQIEMDDGGNAGVGTVPGSATQLTVEAEEGGPSGDGETGISASGETGISATGSGAYYSVGVKANAEGAIGFLGRVLDDHPNYPSFSYGVQGSANGGDGDRSYGVWGSSDDGYAGYFRGDLVYTGDFYQSSDRKFKREIQTLGQGLSSEIQTRVEGFSAPSGGQQQESVRAKLLRLEPKRYRYRTGEYEQMGLPEGEQYGLIAQQVAEVFPSLVGEVVHPGELTRSSSGEVTGMSESVTYQSVNYMELVPMLIQTAREQQAEIDALREELGALKEALRSQGVQVE